MKKESPIGKKVLFAGVIYKVVGVEKNTDKNIFWCDEDYVLESKDGERCKTATCNCYFVPDERVITGKFGRPSDEVDAVSKYIDANGIYSDEIYHDMNALCIHVRRGDWKHDHMFLDHIMGLVGYRAGSSVVTEEDGSDNYSAVHFFYKNVAK